MRSRHPERGRARELRGSLPQSRARRHVAPPITFEHGVLTFRHDAVQADGHFGALELAMEGTFTAGSGTLQFVRDATGRVTGKTLSASRMRGIEFDRLHD